jgi:hypothetical protein
VELLEGEAAGNAVVVQRLRHERGVEATVRTVQRAVETRRQERRAAELATVRYEPARGHQMQIDFGERRISIGGVLVRVFLFVAVLGYSRRIVRRTVEVLVADDEVLVYHGTDVVARHRREFEPHMRIADPAHFVGLYRGAERHEAVASSPYERGLDVYAECLGGAP